MRMILIPLLLFVPVWMLNERLTGTHAAPPAAATTRIPTTVHELPGDDMLRVELRGRVANRVILPHSANGIESLTFTLRSDGTVAVREDFANGAFATVSLHELATIPTRAWAGNYTVASAGGELLVAPVDWESARHFQ